MFAVYVQDGRLNLQFQILSTNYSPELLGIVGAGCWTFLAYHTQPWLINKTLNFPTGKCIIYHFLKITLNFNSRIHAVPQGFLIPVTVSWLPLVGAENESLTFEKAKDSFRKQCFQNNLKEGWLELFTAWLVRSWQKILHQVVKVVW